MGEIDWPGAFQMAQDIMDHVHDVDNMAMAVNAVAVVFAALLALTYYVATSSSTE